MPRPRIGDAVYMLYGVHAAQEVLCACVCRDGVRECVLELCMAKESRVVNDRILVYVFVTLCRSIAGSRLDRDLHS